MAMEIKREIHKIPIMDIYTASWLYLHGNIPELDLRGTRVIFLFPSDENFYRLMDSYNNNSPVFVLDFIKALRTLRSQMLNIRDGRK